MFLSVVIIMIILTEGLPRTDAGFLGSPADAARICWGDKEIAVEKTSIPLIVYYLKSCADTLSFVHSPVKDGLYSILSEKIQNAIPEINRAFYEGNVDLSTVRDLHKLHDRMEPNLRKRSATNKIRVKRNWIKIRSPRFVRKQVMPLIIQANQREKEEACNTLIVVKNSGNRLVRRQVPLPILDNVKKPKRIAVPFISKPLYNLNDSDAKSLLVKYYITGVKCLSLSSEHNQDIFVFNRNFYIWLLKCILPKIERDEKLYPAFGGVFKILETIQDKGLVDLNKEIESTIGSEICVKPSMLFKTDTLTPPQPNASKKSGKVAIASSSFCIIVTLILTSFLFLTWLLIVFLFIFCRCCHYNQINSEKERADNETSGCDGNVLKKKSTFLGKLTSKSSTDKKALTNETRPVSTEFQPLITSTPERELTIVGNGSFATDQPTAACDAAMGKEKLKNSGFSKFLAPLKRDKLAATREGSPLILVDSKGNDQSCAAAKETKETKETKSEDEKKPLNDEKKSESSKNNEKWQCTKDLSRWQCSKDRSKWQCTREKAVDGGGVNETTIKVYPKTLSLNQKKSSASGSCPLKSQKSKDQSKTKERTPSSSPSRKSSSESVKSEQDIEVDSNYKCEIKFCGEPPKCEQCSKNFYNDVKQMLQVLKGDSTVDSATEATNSDDSSKPASMNQTHKKCEMRKLTCPGKSKGKKK